MISTYPYLPVLLGEKSWKDRSKKLTQPENRLLGQCLKAILHLVCFGKISKLITWKYEGTESIKLPTTNKRTKRHF